MNIVHFTLGSVSPDSSNGINRVIEGLAAAMNESGIANVSVVTVRKKMSRPGREIVQRKGFTVTTCHSVLEAIKCLNEMREEIDIVHVHNAWSIHNIIIGRWLYRHKIPYALTPHAAFLPDRMSEKRLIKAFFHRLWQKQLLDRASVLLAVSRDEMESIARYTNNEHIEFVPNGTLPNGCKDFSNLQDGANQKSRLKIGYIGRISREKNIISLIRAIHLLDEDTRSEFEVLLYGPLDNKYASQCIEMASRLEVDSVISFCGSVSSAEKWDRLRELDAYIQPSLSEAASISVLEAISQSLPLIATRVCGVSYWHGEPFIIIVEPIASDIAKGLKAILARRGELANLGQQANAFFLENFTWIRISRTLLEIYDEICRQSQDTDI